MGLLFRARKGRGVDGVVEGVLCERMKTNLCNESRERAAYLVLLDKIDYCI